MKKQEYEKLKSECINSINQKVVFGDGDINSKIVLIGEAPGKQEVIHNMPFCGAAGNQLTEFLEILSLNREQIYITNVVKIRPTKESKAGNTVNRPPNKQEIEYFSDYLFKELDIINPKIIVTLGNVPLKTMIDDKKATIGDYHGNPIKVNGKHIFPLYHPASVIYNRSLKSTYIQDLYKLKEFIEENNL